MSVRDWIRQVVAEGIGRKAFAFLFIGLNVAFGFLLYAIVAYQITHHFRAVETSIQEGVQYSVSANRPLQADVIIQAIREMDRQLGQRQIPVLNRMRPSLGGLEYTGIEQLQ